MLEDRAIALGFIAGLSQRGFTFSVENELICVVGILKNQPQTID